MGTTASTARKALSRYHGKRDFSKTPEPEEGGRAGKGVLSFVIQKHHASHLHYDFRLELDGTLKSWAVPKGPCLDPAVKRMAVHVEDHPISYADFEGTIPPKQYGAGTVIVWDRGGWLPDGSGAADARKALAAGKLRFELRGEKLQGHWTLVRMRGKGDEARAPWLLIKERDDAARDLADYDVLEEEPLSVLTGRGVDDVGGVPAKAAKPAAPARAKASRSTKSETRKQPAMAQKITHADRVIDAQSGTTKGELAAYYAQAASQMLPHLRGRPVALVRAPDGVGGELFFQKHVQNREIPGVRLLDPALDPGHDPLLQIDTAAGLLGAAQMNTIELHTWNGTSRALDRPDRMTFDLDPGEGVEWAQIQEAALLVKTLLDELGLPSFLKTSGGKGLHVVVPLRRHHGWDEVKGFSQAIVQHLARIVPERFVAKSGPRNRVGKIFADYLRNGFGATTVCAWSARSRPGLGVSVPVAWDELPDLTGAAQWTVANIGERIAVGNAPWEAMERSRTGLSAAMKMMGYL
ncbi:bifunctional non-homologous end joining protein LigD [Variovorax boronicumulans]|uniref:non-homologous end-joining DNA ligase n=1 Tax=Variovorax boronicumulans TaxID=436515 RepID=UPI0024745DCE|nr:non-homologous end-joining DNA ligase [Variovorax boronicumulans]MDH6170174.1 bifunctional non-homologous end joining protein LigD [Variovorax boronicumulans]